MRQPGSGSLVRRLIGALTLVLITATAMHADVLATGATHCGRHHQATAHAATPPQAAHAAWLERQKNDCPHCPSSECATLAPCAVGSPPAALPSLTSLAVPPTHRAAEWSAATRVYSASNQPPTPPPQTIA